MTKARRRKLQIDSGLSEFLNDSQPVSSTSPSFKFIFVHISDEHISTIHQVVAWSCSPLKIHSHDNHKNKRAEHRVCCHSSKLVSSFVGTRRHILHHKYYHETVTFVCLSLASRRAGPSPFLHSNLGRKKNVNLDIVMSPTNEHHKKHRQSASCMLLSSREDRLRSLRFTISPVLPTGLVWSLHIGSVNRWRFANWTRVRSSPPPNRFAAQSTFKSVREGRPTTHTTSPTYVT